MNRIIKFRAYVPIAWDDNDNVIKSEMTYDLAFEDYAPINDLLNNFQSPLMQFTGLKDKNWKDIYEGDIVKWGHLPESLEMQIRIAVVKIDPDIQFKRTKENYVFHYGCFAYESNQLELIGNIYENPELLKA